MSKQQLRVGVIGAGAISGNHLAALREIEGATVVGVCDVHADRARARADEFGVPASFGSADELLAHGVDVVTVCTPHPSHEDVVLKAAAAGVHVICEKPIATDIASARRMIEACDEAGVRLGVFFQRRFWPAAQKIRAALDNGTLGEPILGQCSVLLHRKPEYYSKDAWRGTWVNDGGGVLMTQAVHYIDMLQWFMGPVAEVTGRINTFKHGENIEVEDSAVATLVFASGALATLQASTAATPALGAQVRVTGSTGATVQLTEYPEGTDGRLDIWAVGDSVGTTPAHPSDADPNIDLGTINGALTPYHRAQIEEFLDSVREDRDPAISGTDAMQAIKILLAVYESSRTGAPVRFGRQPRLVTVPDAVTAV